MTEAKVDQAAFGVFDFFTFIIPGVLLLLPLIVLAEVRTALVPPQVNAEVVSWSQAMTSTVAGGTALFLLLLVGAYLVGLFLYRASRRVERRLLERKGPPSRRVLLAPTTPALAPPVPDQIRALAREQFRLPPSASDAQIWSLVYRYLIEVANVGRINRFLHLHNLTRSIMLAAAAWAFISTYLLARVEPSLAGTLWLIAAVVTVAANALRRSYNESMAEEVYVTYYVLRAEILRHVPVTEPQGAHAYVTEEG